jgi:hypothetical protein
LVCRHQATYGAIRAACRSRERHGRLANPTGCSMTLLKHPQCQAEIYDRRFRHIINKDGVLGTHNTAKPLRIHSDSIPPFERRLSAPAPFLKSCDEAPIFICSTYRLTVAAHRLGGCHPRQWRKQHDPNRDARSGTLNCMSRIRCSGSPDYELDRPLDNVPIEGV